MFLWIVILDYGESAAKCKRGNLKVLGETEEDARKNAGLMVASFAYVNIVSVERDRSRA